MEIFTRGIFVIYLLTIFSVFSSCNNHGYHTPNVEVLTTLQIPECINDTDSDYETSISKINPEMLGTHSPLVPAATQTFEKDYPNLKTPTEDPDYIKIHPCGFVDSCFGRCGSGPSDRDSIYTYLVSTEKPSSIRTSYLCFCDSECSLYGDCCSDYKVHCRHRSNEMRGQTDTYVMKENDKPTEDSGDLIYGPTSSSTFGPKSTKEQNDEIPDKENRKDENHKRDVLKCSHLNEVDYGSLLVHTKCHKDWKNKNIEILCTDIDYRDDLARLFVQGDDGITYRNIFCAECNFVNVFHFWIQDAYCHGELSAHVAEKPELLSDYLKKNCMTRFRVPYGQVFRPCLKMIDRCPKTVSQEFHRLEENCIKGHLSLVTTKVASSELWGSALYRNAFCAECHGIDQSLLTCPTRDILQQHFLYKSPNPQALTTPIVDRETNNRVVTNYNKADNDLSSTVIFQENGNVVRIIDTCEDGQVFDPYLGECRQLYCSDGYVLVKQNCVPTKATDGLDDDDIKYLVDAINKAINEMVVFEEELVITVKLFVDWDYSDDGDDGGRAEGDVNVPPPVKVPLDRPGINGSGWEIYVTPVYHNVSHSDNEHSNTACEVTVTMVVTNPTEVDRSNAKQFADILDKLAELSNADEMYLYVNGVCVKMHADKDLAFSEILNGNLTDLNYLISHCRNGNLTILESSEFIIIENDGNSCPLVYVNSTSRVYDCHDNYVFGYDNTIPPKEEILGAVVCDPLSPIDPTCERILLNETEYELLPNHSIITEGGTMYHPTEYFQTAEGILVCNVYANIISETVVVFFDFSHAQTVMTYTGLVISSVCLLVTMLTYVIFGELRTLPGLNIMSLMVASIGGNITFIISLSLQPGSMGCQITAVLIHYFFLTRVFWTNAIVFHAFQTFGPKVHAWAHRSLDVLRKRNTRSRIRQYAPYALYAWCVPLAFIGLGSAWHFGACGLLPVYYGMYFSCWMEDPYSFLYLFVVPLAFLLTTNAVLFVPIVCSLHAARKQSSKKLSKNKSPDAKDTVKRPCEIGIYVKLSTTAGFSWLFGILASFADYDFFWYLFILLMSLEGFFIFLSFFCTQRVKSLYSERFGKKCNSLCLHRQSSGLSSGAYVISHQVERRTSSTPKETFTSLTV